jgi:alkylhydroperoxidase family enzyme
LEQTVDARMDEIVGQPPRLTPLEPEALGEKEKAVISDLHEAVGFPRDYPARPNLRTMCRSPELFQTYMAAGVYLMTTVTLTPRDRELIILRTSWLCGSPFGFGEHVKTGKKIGITPDEMERLTLRNHSDEWSDGERAILQAVDELHHDAMIGDATWAALSAYLDDRQLIELLMLAGHYHQTAFLNNALRFRLNADNQGLSAR